MKHKFELSWDENGHKDINIFTQKDWHQTIVTIFNQLSSMIHRDGKTGGADTIEIHPHKFYIISSLEYYKDETKMIGSRYTVVLNENIDEDKIYMYKKGQTDSIGAIALRKKKAFITGITGQDGSYLAEFLLEKGYEVHGVIRRSSSFNTGRIDHIFNKLTLHYGDVTDAANITNLIAQIKPDEIYNLAAQSHVKVSFEQPHYTAMVDGLGTLTILEAMRVHCPGAKFYQASTSELYGGMSYNMPENGYTEESQFHPRSPYGVAKIYGFWAVKNYREAYNLFACNGILFNHESPRRGGTFVTKKVINHMVEISKGKRDVLKIGNMDAKRDWGYAKEYVEAMWKMLQINTPEDFVIATNETHTVRELIELTCEKLNFNLEWRGSGENEKGYDKKTGKLLVEIDSKYFRPSEVETLLGDASKAKRILNWESKVKFKELISIMVSEELLSL